MDFQKAQARHDNSQHPDYYASSRWEYAIEDAMKEGDAMLKRKPAELMALIADMAACADHGDAVRELLRPLFAERQSYALSKLHRAMQTERFEDLKSIAAEALEG